MNNRSMPLGDAIPELPYPDVLQAADWLADTFGFEVRLRIASHRVQLRVGNGSVVLVEGTAGAGHRVMVAVADVDAHHRQAVAAGAKVEGEPVTHMYGERQYAARDFAGHRWLFSQSVEDVDPASFGAPLEGDAEDDEFFRALERRRAAALVDRDMPTVEALHASDYTIITAGGRRFTRERYLATISKDVFYTRWDAGDIDVQRIGNGGVMLRYRGLLGFPSGRTRDVWHTDIYERRDGRWQAVASHATEIPAE